MTTEREILEFAAKAIGIEVIGPMGDDGLQVPIQSGNIWNPLTNSADCADMCAKLGVDTYWIHEKFKMVAVECDVNQICDWRILNDHNNDREAAWRYAATQVAAKIGGMK